MASTSTSTRSRPEGGRRGRVPRTTAAGAAATVDLLNQRQADRIDDQDIDAYVELNWLEWHGGGLRLTITGRNVCAQMAPTAV